MLSLVVSGALALGASDADIRRAVRTCPRAEFKGKSTLADANVVLNEHLRGMEHLTTQACETFSAVDLQAISRKLFGVFQCKFGARFARRITPTIQVLSSKGVGRRTL